MEGMPLSRGWGANPTQSVTRSWLIVPETNAPETTSEIVLNPPIINIHIQLGRGGLFVCKMMNDVFFLFIKCN
jgi:hypothetical protein